MADTIENSHNTTGDPDMVPTNIQRVLSAGVNLSHFSVSVILDADVQEKPCILRQLVLLKRDIFSPGPLPNFLKIIHKSLK